jgi:hypothetical protein
MLNVASVPLAEALAMLHDLKLEQNLGYTSVEAESDSLEVIQQCMCAERIWCDAVTIYAEIIAVAGCIGVVEFSHCRREMNKVAHDIARDSFVSKNS